MLNLMGSKDDNTEDNYNAYTLFLILILLILSEKVLFELINFIKLHSPKDRE